MTADNHVYMAWHDASRINFQPFLYLTKLPAFNQLVLIFVANEHVHPINRGKTDKVYLIAVPKFILPAHAMKLINYGQTKRTTLYCNRIFCTLKISIQICQQLPPMVRPLNFYWRKRLACALTKVASRKLLHRAGQAILPVGGPLNVAAFRGTSGTLAPWWSFLMRYMAAAVCGEGEPCAKWGYIVTIIGAGSIKEDPRGLFVFRTKV